MIYVYLVFIDIFIRYFELVFNLLLFVNIIKKVVVCKIYVLVILLRKSYFKLNIFMEVIMSVGCYCVDVFWVYVGSYKSVVR